MSLIKQGFFLF